MKRPFIFVSVITFLLQLCAAENYYVYNDNGKQGIVDSNYSIVIEPRYKYIQKTNAFFLCMNENDTVYILDDNLNYIYSAEDVFLSTAVSESLVQIQHKDFKKVEVLNARTGKVVELPYEDRLRAGNSDESKYYASQGFYYNKDFSSKSFNYFDMTFPFSEEMAVVFTTSIKGSEFDVININGDIVCKGIKECAYTFSENLLAVVLGKKKGFINTKGDFVFETSFYIDSDWFGPRAEPILPYSFNEGVAVIQNDKLKWQLIDKNGSCKDFPSNITPESYRFSSGLLLVSKIIDGEKKYGFITKEFKLLIPCLFEEAVSFDGLYASIKFDEKTYLVDKKGVIHKITENNSYIKSNKKIDKYLIENGFKKVDGFAPSDYYIFKKSEENKFYIPFTYGEERMIDDQKVVVCYIFTEIGNEMINRYTSISFFDKDENRFVYEKENKTMDSGNRTMIWKGKVGHKGSIQYENPVLYLWE